MKKADMREEEYCCVNYFLNVHVAFVSSQTYQKSSPSARPSIRDLSL